MKNRERWEEGSHRENSCTITSLSSNVMTIFTWIMILDSVTRWLEVGQGRRVGGSAFGCECPFGYSCFLLLQLVLSEHTMLNYTSPQASVTKSYLLPTGHPWMTTVPPLEVFYLLLTNNGCLGGCG